MASAALFVRRKLLSHHLHHYMVRGSKNHDVSMNFSALTLFRSRPSVSFIIGPRTDPLYVRYCSTHCDGEHVSAEINDKPTRFKTVGRVWSTILGVGPALRVVALMIRKVWDVEKIDVKIAYYAMKAWFGFSIDLLRADVRISLRLMAKLSHGMSLSRRERQLLTRATADIFRLIPASIYIVVPSIELLLPVILKLYPNILPLTFKDKMEEQEPAIRKLKARREFAKFLHDTASEMVKVVQNSRSGDIKPSAEEFIEFAAKILRRTPVSSVEIIRFAKLFTDDLTLYNTGRPLLVIMCKCMGITPLGTDEYLSFILQERLKFIREEDNLIQAKGVESLSEAELHKACRGRGINVAEDMHQQLRDWLDLSLNHSLPSSILILSRACNVTGNLKPVEAVLHALFILPYELKHLVGVASLPCKCSIKDKFRKLESLALLEKLIKEEEEKELSKMKQSDAVQDDVALKEMTVSMPEQDRARTMDKQEQLSKLISDAITVLSSALNVCRECEKISGLANNKADSMLRNLVDDMDAETGSRWQVLDRYCDGKVSPDVVAAATFLKNTLDKEGIQDLLSHLSKYKDEIVKLGFGAEDDNQGEKRLAGSI